jgi:hypothetical protein
MTETRLLDRIGHELADALARQREAPESRGRGRLIIPWVAALALVLGAAAVSGAAGVGPFDRLFSNEAVSRPSANPGTIDLAVPGRAGRWSVIAYRRRDGGVGVSAASDRDQSKLPGVRWMSPAGIAGVFRTVGPAVVYTHEIGNESDGSMLVYGLLEQGTRRISLTVAGRPVRVYRSDEELQLRTDGSNAMRLRLFAAPIDGLPSDSTRPAHLQLVRSNGRASELVVPLG